MIFVILCILIVIFTFFIATTLIKMRETWIYETKKKPLNQQFRKIQSSFKELVLPLYNDDIINLATKQRLTAIASNFFVFQPMSETNIERLLIIVDSCQSVFEQCIIANAQYPDQFPAIFEKLLNVIPTGARDFDAEFYNISLPSAFETFDASIQKLTKRSFFEELDDEDDDAKDFDIFQEQARLEKQKQLLENNAQKLSEQQP